MAEFWLRWTVRLALVCYVWRLWEGARWEGVLSRVVWLSGSLLLLAHALLALGAVHGWSHAHAYRHTAEQTRALTGVDWGGGVYLNEVTIALWLADALWLVFVPLSHSRRPAWIGIALHAWLLFMAINGAIVFANGPTRWISAAVLIVLCVTAVARYRPSFTHRKPV